MFAACIVAFAAAPHVACATDKGNASSESPSQAAMAKKIDAMQKQINVLQKQLDVMRAKLARTNKRLTMRKNLTRVAENNKKKKAEKTKEREKAGINFGGAMRFQYSYEDYNHQNVKRRGDVDFDIFRLNMRGKVDNIELQAEWRWFQYMSAIKFAWIGYDFGTNSQLQLGITRIPFGNQPYNSHNYFFSSNYYLGLEDTYHAGIEYVYSGDPWNVQLAFFKNDAQGGIGTGHQRKDSYSYNVVGVRAPGEGNFADPMTPAGSIDTSAARVTYTLKPSAELKVRLGASALHGGLRGLTSSLGNYHAYALHMNAFYKRLNVQLQASRYQYNVDGGADRLAVGAYDFYDSIAARADSYTFNLKYHQPVQWGPIHGLDFYNDYSLITNKSGLLPSTFMDVLGVGVSAGDLYTYFDFVTARNQPFIGGSMAGDGPVEHRFNINFGFYF